MAVFVVLLPYLLTTKLSCLQINNFGHTKLTAGLINNDFAYTAFTDKETDASWDISII